MNIALHEVPLAPLLFTDPILLFGVSQFRLPFTDRERIVHRHVRSSDRNSCEKTLCDVVSKGIAYDYGQEFGCR